MAVSWTCLCIPMAFGESSALRFSRDGQCVVVADSDALDITGPLTIEAWVKPEQGIQGKWFDFIVSKQMAGTGYTLLSVGNRFQFEANTIGIASPVEIPINSWVHVAGVWDSGSLKLYLNGNLSAQTADAPVPPIANDFPLWIGSSPFGADTNWRGVIDEVRIWSIARTQSEIQSAMNHYLTGNEPGLAAYWSFSEGTGQFVRDVTGNVQAGRLGDSGNSDQNDPEWVEGKALTGDRQPPPFVRVHALLVGCEQVSSYILPYHGWKEVNALKSALCSLPNCNEDDVETLYLDDSSTDPRAQVLDRIAEFEVGAGETFVLFVGGHGNPLGEVFLHSPCEYLQVEWLLSRTDLVSALTSASGGIAANATKLVILPGCNTGSFWPDGTNNDLDRLGLHNVPNTCLLAGAPGDAASFVYPVPFVDAQGHTPLTLTVCEGLQRTSHGRSRCDANRDGVITFDELRNFVLSANDSDFLWLWYPFDFQGWSTFDGELWPVLSEFGSLQPFDYNPTGIADEAGFQALMANSDTDSNCPPVADAGEDLVVYADENGLATVLLSGQASYDPDGDPLAYEWYWLIDDVLHQAEGPSPTISLPLGQFEISLLVSDSLGVSEGDAVNVTVLDQRPPDLAVLASPEVLWPPNHKMVEVTVSTEVTDNSDSSPTVHLKSITSNEADRTETFCPVFDDSLADGNTANDIQVTQDGRIFLRAERSGNSDGRVYTITYEATDASGNASNASATVTVPHNM